MTRPSRLRILIVTPGLSYPPSDGFSIRVAGLLHELALRHRVTVITYDHAVGDAAALRQLGVDIRLDSTWSSPFDTLEMAFGHLVAFIPEPLLPVYRHATCHH